MPTNVKIYDGTSDQADHITRFKGMGNSAEWPMLRVGENAKANWARKKMAKVTGEKIYAIVREEDKYTGLRKLSKATKQLMEA
ncbi:hypothetical protein Tco_0949264 [Tanacetum coccineum]